LSAPFDDATARAWFWRFSATAAAAPPTVAENRYWPAGKAGTVPA
jgi:hypothetical protein